MKICKKNQNLEKSPKNLRLLRREDRIRLNQNSQQTNLDRDTNTIQNSKSGSNTKFFLQTRTKLEIPVKYSAWDTVAKS